MKKIQLAIFVAIAVVIFGSTWTASLCAQEICSINTIAGDTTFGDNGLASEARLSLVHGVAVDSAGNVYISDSSIGRIRKISPSGIITTFAGTGGGGDLGDGGLATMASLSPGDVAMDSHSNLYIASAHRIRKIDTAGNIFTIAGTGERGFSGDGGPATSAKLASPNGIAVDTSGNVYFADTDNNRIRKISSDGRITTVAGVGVSLVGFSGDNGPAVEAGLRWPRDIAIDSAGNLFIADTHNQRIRKVDASGIITTIAGTIFSGPIPFGYTGDGGSALYAQLSYPSGIVVDSSGNIYIASTSHTAPAKRGA